MSLDNPGSPSAETTESRDDSSHDSKSPERVVVKKSVYASNLTDRYFHTSVDCPIPKRFDSDEYTTVPRTEVAQSPHWTQCRVCADPGSASQDTTGTRHCPYCGETVSARQFPRHLTTCDDTQ
jgi:hypothetical protein